MNDALQTSRAQRLLPPTDPNRRVEVVVTQVPGGGRNVLLRDLSFGPGIGWYVEKTIRLDPEQADALRRALCCARQPCSGQVKGVAAVSNPPGSPSGEARIIQLSRRLRPDSA